MNKSTEKKLAIIIPVYNERPNIKELIEWLADQIPNFPCTTEVYFIDDRSWDRTTRLIRKNIKDKPNFHLIQRTGRRNRGLSVIFGMKIALREQPDYIVEMNANLSHDPRYISEFIEVLEKSPKIQMVNSSRFLETSDFKNRRFYQNMMSVASTKFLQVMFKLPFTDPNSQFRVYRASMLKKILPLLITADPREILIKTYYFGFEIEEFPIVFIDRQKGRSKFGILEFSRVLRAMVMVRRNLKNLAHL